MVERRRKRAILQKKCASAAAAAARSIFSGSGEKEEASAVRENIRTNPLGPRENPEKAWGYCFESAQKVRKLFFFRKDLGYFVKKYPA